MERVTNQEAARLNDVVATTGKSNRHLEPNKPKLIEWCGRIEAQVAAQQVQLHNIQQLLIGLNKTSLHSFESKEQQLSKDINQINRRRDTKIEAFTRHTILKNEKILRRFQWHSFILTVATTLLTTWALALYMNSEYPWETHQHASQERNAGKLLLKAWPILSQAEKTKIAGNKTA